MELNMADNETIYNFDTSAFIAFQTLYPMDMFPQVWEKLDELFRKKRAYFIEEVRNEIQKRDDDVARWLKKRESYGMKSQTTEDFLKAKEVVVSNQGLIDVNAIQTSADPFVIADSIRSGLLLLRAKGKMGQFKATQNPKRLRNYNVRCIYGQYYATEFFREIGWTFN